MHRTARVSTMFLCTSAATSIITREVGVRTLLVRVSYSQCVGHHHSIGGFGLAAAAADPVAPPPRTLGPPRSALQLH